MALAICFVVQGTQLLMVQEKQRGTRCDAEEPENGLGMRSAVAEQESGLGSPSGEGERESELGCCDAEERENEP